MIDLDKRDQIRGNLRKTNTVKDVIKQLRSKSDPEQLNGMQRFGLTKEGRLGVKVPEMRKIAKGIGKDPALALALWETGIIEARIIAGMVAKPGELTEEQMESWVVEVNSWDLCDQLCMNLFEKSPHALKKIHEWAAREEEFVKRAAYALIACLAWHDKQAEDAFFIDLLPVIKAGADDERNYVKKAVNWALRNIGKRNLNLNLHAILAAEGILEIDSRAARWIASDALRELKSEKVQARLRK